MAAGSTYTYTKLNDLLCPSKVNIHAIVCSLRSKYVETTGQWELKLWLTDDSLDAGDVIECSIYASDEDSKPAVERMGDIIRLHRIQVGRHPRHEGHRLVGCIGVSGCHAVVWDGRHGVSLVPRRMTSRKCTYDSVTDGRRVLALREWFVNLEPIDVDDFSFHFPHAATDQGYSSISSFIRHAYRDIQGKVVGRFTIDDRTVLRIWDGSILKIKTAKLLPEEVEEIRDRSSICDDVLRDLVEEFVVDVFVYDEHREVANQLTVGDNVLLGNVHLCLATGDNSRYLAMHTGGAKFKRSILKVGDDDARVQAWLRGLHELLHIIYEDEYAPAQEQPPSTSNDSIAAEQLANRRTTELRYEERHRTPSSGSSSGFVTASEQLAPIQRNDLDVYVTAEEGRPLHSADYGMDASADSSNDSDIVCSEPQPKMQLRNLRIRTSCQRDATGQTLPTQSSTTMRQQLSQPGNSEAPSSNSDLSKGRWRSEWRDLCAALRQRYPDVRFFSKENDAVLIDISTLSHQLVKVCKRWQDMDRSHITRDLRLIEKLQSAGKRLASGEISNDTSDTNQHDPSDDDYTSNVEHLLECSQLKMLFDRLNECNNAT